MDNIELKKYNLDSTYLKKYVHSIDGLNMSLLNKFLMGIATAEEKKELKEDYDNRALKEKIESVNESLVDAPCNTENRLYYYVDLSVFINCIVEKSELIDRKISLLAGHCDYMNDSSEFRIGHGVIKENKAINPSIAHNIEELKNLSPFMISFSKAKDSLPMWHLYAKDAGGVMLCFDMKKISALFKRKIKNVIYNNSKAYTAMCDYIVNTDKYLSKEIDSSTGEPTNKAVETFQKALEWFPFITKTAYFEYEQEVRLSRIDWSDKDMMYIPKHGLLCPYRKLYFPANFLKEIYLSPKLSSELTRQSLRKFLDQNSLSEVEIQTSQIPYRG